MVLTKGDDFPIHQTPEPVAYAGTDRNFYDRYFFNGYSADGSTFFAAAFGIYPHLDVMDAHFSVVRDGNQYNLHASAEMAMERMALACGPIRIEIVEPLKSLRVIVEEFDGIAADITFTSRAFPIEEPRFTHRTGSRLFMDYTRMTQNGSYSGWISVDGVREELAENIMGTRDRSWGIRPVGASDAQPVPGAPAPSFFWQWTPVNMPGGSLFYHINAEPDGRAWNTRAAWVPEGGRVDAIVEGHGKLSAGLESGTRWPNTATLELDLPNGPKKLTFEPLQRFQMRGLGYTHPVWNHGLHHGALQVEREDLVLADLDPLSPENLHVQIVSRVTDQDGNVGTGAFEQLAIGPYAPLGLTEFLDGAD